MKKFEGLFILAQSLDEHTLEEKLEKIRLEITKLGGTVEHTTRLGRMAFARRLDKNDAGFYILLTFLMEPGQIAPLREKFRLQEDVFRLQITRARETGSKDRSADAAKTNEVETK